MIDESEFAKRVKAKYPAYRELPDTDLVQRVLAKFPEYSKVVLPSNAAPELGQGLMENQTTQVQPDTSLQGLGHAAYLKGVGGMEIAPEQEQALGGLVEGAALASIPVGAMIKSAQAVPTIKQASRGGGVTALSPKGQAARSAMAMPEASVVQSPLELELTSALKQNIPARQAAMAKLAETNPIAALKSGLPVKQWATLDKWMAETKAVLGETPEAMAMVETKAKNLIDQAMGILPTLQDRPGFILGPNAKTWETANAPVQEDATGEFAFKELSDKSMAVRAPAINKLQQHPIFLDALLGGKLKEEPLFAAYPQLKDYTVVAGEKTQFFPDTKEIVLALDEETISILNNMDEYFTPAQQKVFLRDNIKDPILHEITHGIQEIEGWPRGGSPDEFSQGRTPAQAREKYLSLNGELHANLTEARSDFSQPLLDRHPRHMDMPTKAKQLVLPQEVSVTQSADDLTRSQAWNEQNAKELARVNTALPKVPEVSIEGWKQEVLPTGETNLTNAKGYSVLVPKGADATKIVKAINELEKVQGGKPVAKTVAQEKTALRRELKKTPNAKPWAANKVMEVLDDPKTPVRMPKEGFLNVLKNKQVKPEQLEWDGLNDFLKGKESITKAEVKKFVEENGLNLTEIDKGTRKNVVKPVKAMPWTTDAHTFDVEFTNGEHRAYTADSPTEAMGLAQIDIGSSPLNDDTSYGRMKDLQLPGGKNYREKRFQLPIPKNSAPMEKTPPEVEAILDRYDKGEIDDNFAKRLARNAGYELRWDPDQDLPFVYKAGKDLHAPFRSGAYPEEGIVAETRYTDRTIGKDKVVYLEEVQSHMHQAGRAQGYRNTPITELPEGYKVLEANVVNGRVNVTPNGDYFVVVDPTGKPIDWEGGNPVAPTKEKALDIGLKVLRENSGIPNAPFKAGKHVELVMKRMVRQAIEEGKDGVAWTTGQMQKDRYNLAKQVSKVDYVVNKDGTLDYAVYKKNGAYALGHEKQKPEEAAGIIGKDLVAKMQQGAGEVADTTEGNDFKSMYKDGKILSGLDLKIGGKWADNLYDQQMVNFANKFFGKWGAKVKNEIMTITPTPTSLNTLEETMEGIVPGTDTFEEARDTFQNEHNWDGLTEEMFEDMIDMDKSRVSTPKQWATFLKKEMKKPYEVETWYMKFTPELIRAALKQGFPLFTGVGAAGLAGKEVSRE